ncbi:nitrate regulatory protein NasR [Enterobacter mori]|uniref:nitrate regulatory protein NasR n=1 Tax=Enterobacter mori TaxID=539813 RepID=UPI0021B14865|nr:nitrate regulatory protein NasR [Enterobacter mori]UWX91503.1 nitrate regulatory protein NasR [Enterobacter mori]
MTLMADSSPAATEWFQRATLLRREQLGRLAALGVLVNGISRLVHMLQCERGASNVWLCSQGKLYAPECKASRGLVDENLTALQAMLKAQFPVTGSGVCERIACALLSLETLPLQRDGIDTQSITAPQAMEHYCRMLRQLLSIVPQLNDSIDDPQIAGRFVALYSLMQGKELVGQERALGAIGFTQGFFNDETRQRLVDRIDGQQACFEIFLSHSHAEVQNTFAHNCQPDRETEQLRRVACTRQPAADNGNTALNWFALQTSRLEHLRTLEERVIADLMVAVDDAIQASGEATMRGEEHDDPLALYPDKPLLLLVRQQAREIDQLSRQLASLRDTLEERKTIDKAKSVLMTHQSMSEEQAWTTLRKMAMDKNQRMVDIARALLTVKNLWQLTPKE